MHRLNKYRAFDNVLQKFLTLEETNAYPLEALLIPGTITFTQFTGFKDKKKNEIYEGDIVDDGEKAWRILFSEGTFVGWGPGRWRPLRQFIGHGTAYIEIVGNCFENPRIEVCR